MRRVIWVMLVVMLLLVVSVPLAGGSGAGQEGTIGGDKLVMGGNYTLASEQTLGGNLAVLGGNAMLEPGSTVNGDVVLMGGNLDVAGTIRGSLTVFGGNVELRSSAVVEGDLASFGGSVMRAPGAVVQGETIDRVRPFFPWRLTPNFPAAPYVERPTPVVSFIRWQIGTLGAALLAAILGVLLVLILPRPMGRVMVAAATQPALSFGLGLLTLALGVVAGALLLIACGLGLLVWLALLAGLLMGWAAVGLWLGERLLSALRLRSTSAVAEVATGAFIITILARLPLCMGFLVGLVLGSIGLGAVVLTRFGLRLADGIAPAMYAPPPLPPHPALPPERSLPAGQPPADTAVTPPPSEPPIAAERTDAP
jgi:hypothetical protein